MKINPSMVAESIAEICKRCNKPLQEDQKLALVGALAVWLDKSYVNGYRDAIKEVIGDLKKPPGDAS